MKKDWKRRARRERIDLAKMHYREWMTSAIGNIHSVECWMDKMAFSGPYKRSDVQAVFGNLKQDADYIPEKRMPAYDRKFIRDMKGFKLDFFMKPNQYRPLLYLEAFPKENVALEDWHQLLIKLDSHFPELIVSGIEFALDLFSKGPTARVFKVINRYLYIPGVSSKAEVYFYSEKGQEGGEVEGQDFKVNFMHRIGRDYKVYERGSDRDKNNGCWMRKNVNRVRLEYWVKRKSLIKYALQKPRDVLQCPKFQEINQDRWQFKKCEHSKILPRWFEDYPTRDSKGNGGILMLEILKNRKEVKNISQYLEDEDMLNICIKPRMKEAMESFDEKWIWARAMQEWDREENSMEKIKNEGRKESESSN